MTSHLHGGEENSKTGMRDVRRLLRTHAAPRVPDTVREWLPAPRTDEPRAACVGRT